MRHLHTSTSSDLGTGFWQKFRQVGAPQTSSSQDQDESSMTFGVAAATDASLDSW